MIRWYGARPAWIRAGQPEGGGWSRCCDRDPGHRDLGRCRGGRWACRLGETIDMTLAIAIEDEPTATVVAVGGELDLNTAPELLHALTRLVDEGRRTLIVDLAEVGFCDSSGLSVLVRARNRLDQLGGVMVLACATPIVARVLEVSGLVEVFGTYPTVAAARAAQT
jgi:anti-anti-sigma factor